MSTAATTLIHYRWNLHYPLYKGNDPSDSKRYPSMVVARSGAYIAVDLLIHARWVVPIRPVAKTVLSRHSLAVRDGKILDVLPTEHALSKYTAASTISRPRHAVMPGLINAHTHTGMNLMRGCADDSTLHDWLRGRVWPIEAEFLTQEGFCYDGALLATAEMTRGGTTTFNDMYWDPDAAARATLEAGMRATLGIVLIGFPSKYGTTTEQYLERGEKTRKKYAKHPTLDFAYCPHAPYTVPDDAWKEVVKRALDTDALVHTHIHETAEEVHSSEVLDKTHEACHLSDNAARPLANLESLGLLKTKMVSAHMCHTNANDIKMLSDNSDTVSIAHCPTSNAKLAVGFCDTLGLQKNSINVSLGTDSACSNNNLDMFSEMKLATLFAKNLSGDASVLPAETALEMATINGAKSLHKEAEIGSLEVGKCADFITVEMGTHVGNSPVFCVLSALVYAAARTDVVDVYVDGKCLMHEKKLLRFDEESLVKKAQEWADKIEAKFPSGKPLESVPIEKAVVGVEATK